MTLFATFIPFSDLDDFVSAGILVAFTVTNCSLVIMRRQSPESNPNLLPKLLALFNLFSFLTCITVSHGLHLPIGWVFAILLGLTSIMLARKMAIQCPPTSSFGGATNKTIQLFGERKYFSTPLVPYLPCVGMTANFFLISQLSFFGIGLLLIYALAAIVLYFLHGARHSVGRNEGWEQQYSSIDEKEPAHDHPANEEDHSSIHDGVMT